MTNSCKRKMKRYCRIGGIYDPETNKCVKIPRGNKKSEKSVFYPDLDLIEIFITYLQMKHQNTCVIKDILYIQTDSQRFINTNSIENRSSIVYK